MKNILFACLFLFSIFIETSFIYAIQPKEARRAQIFPQESIAHYEELCHQEINKIREKHGLQPLKWWKELADCAREHSQNMADGSCAFGHDGFDERYKKMNKKNRLYFFGENVAYCYNYPDPVEACVDGWMNSEGHRENILEDFEESGIGVVITKEGKFFIVQLFANRR